MVLTLIIPARKLLGLEHVITMRHLDNMAKVILATGLMVTYGYVMEHFMAWYGGNPYEAFAFLNRWTGPYAPIWYMQLFCNVLVPQIFWFPTMRRNLVVLFVVSILVNVGMWAERFVIIVISLHRDFLPVQLGHVHARPGSTGASSSAPCASSALLFLLFLRFVPVVPIAEVKELRHELDHARRARRGQAAHAGGDAVKRYVVAEFAAEAPLLDGGPGAARRGAAPSSTSTRRARSTAPTRRWG